MRGLKLWAWLGGLAVVWSALTFVIVQVVALVAPASDAIVIVAQVVALIAIAALVTVASLALGAPRQSPYAVPLGSLPIAGTLLFVAWPSPVAFAPAMLLVAQILLVFLLAPSLGAFVSRMLFERNRGSNFVGQGRSD